MANRKRKAKEEAAPPPRPENWPTPEFERNLTRQRFEGEITAAIEVYRTKPVAGRDRESEGIRIVSQIEMMHRQGRLTGNEVRAAQDFYRDFSIGVLSGPRVTSRYGELVAWGGTPLSQQARDLERMTPEERKSDHYGKFAKACEAIWKAGVPLNVIELAIRLLCELGLADEQRLVSLRDIGEHSMHYQQPQQAQASGATYLKMILRQLALHYGYDEYERPKKGVFLRLQ